MSGVDRQLCLTKNAYGEGEYDFEVFKETETEKASKGGYFTGILLGTKHQISVMKNCGSLLYKYNNLRILPLDFLLKSKNRNLKLKIPQKLVF
jgi:hypothetical protein